ncbi:GD14988 [Drosophila simulans]|uniref:GD14988 n=1 Tax=Drosophila simulans TaxID=7240 RepID=B4QK91_DROSI|nr:GD14988 [Drosophila simulans]
MARLNLWKKLKELECLTCSCHGCGVAGGHGSGSGRWAVVASWWLVGAEVTELAEIVKRATTEHATARTNVDIKLLPGTRNRDRERERHGMGWQTGGDYISSFR